MRFGIRRKLFLSVGMMLCFFGVLGIVAQLGIRSVHNQFTEIVDSSSRINLTAAAEQTFHQTADRTERRLLVLILGGFVVGVFSVYFITRSVVRPIDLLVSATDRVARGDPVRRVDIHTGDEFEVLAEHFNQMVAERERLDKMKSDFTFMMTHELNTPIAVASGAVDLLKVSLTEPNEKQALYLGMIHRSAAKLQRLTADLVDLMKLESGHFSFRPKSTDIQEPVRSACQFLTPMAKERGILLQFPSADTSPQILPNVDPDRIEQVVGNLVRNAIRFARSKVEVRVEDAPGGYLILVEDDGPGIDESDMPKLFDKFYRGKQPPDQKKSGSGLGLAIVKGIVGSHGGTVQATNRGSEPGAKFVVRLPKHG